MKKFTALKIIAAITVVGIVLIAVLAYFSDYKNAKKYYELGGDNPALFLAIAKAESDFRETAISSKGAVGLCQIMPKTAEWCALQMGIAYDENMLLNAEYNAAIAVFYIDYLLNKFDESAAICAYNAGEGNVSAWILDDAVYKNGVFINIPFEETKNYLKKVSANKSRFEFYLWFFGWERE